MKILASTAAAAAAAALAWSTGKEMRIIALTGYGRDTDIALARDAGFDGHLVKPYEFKDLEKLRPARLLILGADPHLRANLRTRAP